MRAAATGLVWLLALGTSSCSPTAGLDSGLFTFDGGHDTGPDAGIDAGPRPDGGPPVRDSGPRADTALDASASSDGGSAEDAGGDVGAGIDASAGSDAGPDGGVLVPPEEAMLLAVGAAANDVFGNPVALSADGLYALVGGSGDDTPRGPDAGSARVFARTGTTWTEEATLLAPGGAAGDWFGGAVALSADGSRALVGAFGDATTAGAFAGSAHVFLRTGTTWTSEATLLASDGAALDYFGTSVALSADGLRALVSATGDDTVGGADVGSVRVFLRTGTTWVEEATLLATGGAPSDFFGDSLAVSDDGSRALVGASGDDTAGGANAGSAHVFLRVDTTWAVEAVLLAAGGADADLFGRSVALSGDGTRALVGAVGDVAAGSATGSARVFSRTGTAWLEEATVLASDGAATDGFGESVALSADGRRALVGANGDDTAAGADAGSARVFRRSGTAWAEETTLLATHGASSDLFGISVGLCADGSRAIVGANFHDTAGAMNAGSAHVFLLAP